MFTPDLVIPILKVAVGAVTLLLAASLVALASGRKRLHGRINTLFFVLTMTTVLGFEVIVRFMNPHFTSSFTQEQRQLLYIHLCFSIPAAIILPFMFYSGTMGRRWHVALAFLFGLFWLGTFITGVFYLPY